MRTALSSIYRCSLGIGLLAAGCSRQADSPEAGPPNTPPLVSAPLPTRGTTPRAGFTRLDPGQTGVTARELLDTNHPLKRIYVAGHVCGGVAIGDVDADGRPDVFIVSNRDENHLYRQIAPWKFEDVAVAAGVGGGPNAWGAGAALVDIDGDGDLDIYVCNYDAPNQLFLNQGRGAGGQVRFTEQAERFGLAIRDACIMPAFCDYDRDGDLDVYIVCYRLDRAGGFPSGRLYELGPDRRPRLLADYDRYYGMVQLDARRVYISTVGRQDYLLRNEGSDAQGQIHFREVSDEAGIHGRFMGLSATWWDYDGDGWPDLFVANDFEGPDRLYRNHRNGTFTDVSREVFPHTTYSSMGSVAADFNNDGLEDLFVVDMAGSTRFKRMLSNGAMGAKQQAALDFSEPRQVMRNALLLNTGLGRMLEAAHLAGVARTDWSWAPKAGDFDEDGRLDLFVTTGMTRDLTHGDVPRGPMQQPGVTEWDYFEATPPRRDPNFAFRNEGDLRFSEVTASWGLAHVGLSFGAALGDLDGDGDLDLVVRHLDEPVSLYRNDAAGAHRLLVRLRGRAPNTFGLAAQVRVQSASGRQVRTLQPVSGYVGCDDPALHFGLGPDATIDALEVTWPDGSSQQFTELAADQVVTITQPRAERGRPRPQTTREQRGDPGLSSVPPLRPGAAASRRRVGWRETAGEPPASPGSPLFFPSPILAGATHRERPFDDFAQQPLLPHRCSQLGPGMAWGDVDGDGDDDLYLGGAAGQPGQLWLNHGKGRFAPVRVEAFDTDAACEDMGALFFDAEGDGNLDLYVVSGSYEFSRGDGALADRLYLNDGQGRFTKAPPGTLPEERDSGGPVVAADFDRDGDLDLFVGGRLVPGDYPATPESRLLVNDSGRFRDGTDALASQLRQTGLVTAALWSDADGDGWLDLLLTHEWGPLRIFRNERGQLVAWDPPVVLPVSRNTEHGTRLPLHELTGWWTSIAGGDFDHDGDIDYVVGNLGLNTAYVATPERPWLAYVGDFAGDGRRLMLEAMEEGGKLFPMRPYYDVAQAIPSVRERFQTFTAYAQAPLSELLPRESMEKAQRLELTCLESGILWNHDAEARQAGNSLSPADGGEGRGEGGDSRDTPVREKSLPVPTTRTPHPHPLPLTEGEREKPSHGTARFTFQPLPRLAQISPVFGSAVFDANGDGHPDLALAQTFFGPQREIGRMDGGAGAILLGDGRGRFTALMPAQSGCLAPGDAKSLTVSDLNGDGHPDLVVAQNDGPLRVFTQNPAAPRPLQVSLSGPRGNPAAIGARVALECADGHRHTAEVQAGTGYLSQSSSVLWFSVRAGAKPERWRVRWPDGTATEHAFQPQWLEVGRGRLEKK